MHLLGREQRTGQRSLGSGEYPGILTPCKLQDLAGIPDGMMKGNVAGNGTDPENLDQGRAQSR